MGFTYGRICEVRRTKSMEKNSLETDFIPEDTVDLHACMLQVIYVDHLSIHSQSPSPPHLATHITQY